jgi:hypothetical protein
VSELLQWDIFLTCSPCSFLHEDNDEKVTVYRADAIAKHATLGFTNEDFLMIALLVGGDYDVRCPIHSYDWDLMLGFAVGWP